MEKQYTYRKHIRIMQKAIPTILGCLAVLILILSIVLAFSMKNELKLVFIIPGVFLSFIISIEALSIWLIFRRFTKVSVKLTEDYLIYTNIKDQHLVLMRIVLK